jgi:hypothetical protein
MLSREARPYLSEIEKNAIIFFPSVRGTILFPQEAWSCHSKTKKNVFSFVRGTVLLSREAWPCLSKAEKNAFFFLPWDEQVDSRGSTDLLPRAAQSCLFRKGKNVLPVRIFREKSLSKSINMQFSFEDLDLRNSMVKMFEIWTHGLRDKTLWITGPTRNRKILRLQQVAHMQCATCRNLGGRSDLWKEYFLISDFVFTSHKLFSAFLSCGRRWAFRVCMGSPWFVSFFLFQARLLISFIFSLLLG